MSTEPNEVYVGMGLNGELEEPLSHRDRLLAIPKAPIPIDETRRGPIAKTLLASINLAVFTLIVSSPLWLAYLLGKADIAKNLFIPVSILCFFVLSAYIILTVAIATQKEPGSLPFVNGLYFAHWQVDAQQQNRIRKFLRLKMWKGSLLAIAIFGLIGLGLGLGPGQDLALEPGGRQAWVYAIGGLILCSGLGALTVVYVQWQRRKQNGISQLPNADVIIGPSGLYLAGENTPLDSLSRVFISEEKPDELQFEFLNGEKTPVPYPAEKADDAAALMSLLNEQDIASLGLLALEPTPEPKSTGSSSVGTEQSSQHAGDEPGVHYSYKDAASTPATTLRLTDDCLELLNSRLEVVRQIQYAQIQSLHEYDGIRAVDPETGSYKTQFCRLRFAKGKSINVRNGIYICPNGKMGEVSANRQKEFQYFFDSLKRHIAATSPQTPVITGVRVVAQMFGLVAFACVLILALMLVGMWDKDAFPGPLQVLGLCILLGIPILGSLYVAHLYWPRSRPVIDDVGVDKNKHDKSI